ncbi:MAG: Stp1/IreP family PP2C-type Ser/Thr phosphatase [Candidatus Zixiibacteriota bacterium]|nr:MAG: Stp1/IreP family PP2C-type Ser/Thr phosphatase [candidate division Zixibacteria bacterium]
MTGEHWNQQQGCPLAFEVKVVGKTDVGLVRSGNEDFIHLDENHHVYAVCDGMGGHQAGEVASMTASETVLNAFTHFSRPLLDDSKIGINQTLPPNGEILVKSIRLANRSIFNMALVDQALAGMGTTIVAVALESDIMTVAHVGDSRAYRLRQRDLEPLTKDHSWVAEIQETQDLSEEEASSFVGKNVITRALGVRENVAIDCRVIKVAAGDKFILCSDGLCGFADDDEIFEVARRHQDDLEKMTADLIQMANDRGGSDNVSIIAIEIISVDESPLPPIEVFTIKEENEDVLAAEDAWIEKLSSFSSPSGETQSDNSSDSGTNWVMLVSIFLAFVIVAVLILWLQTE